MCLSCSGDSQVICTKLVNRIIYVDQPGCLLALKWRDVTGHTHCYPQSCGGGSQWWAGALTDMVGSLQSSVFIVITDRYITHTYTIHYTHVASLGHSLGGDTPYIFWNKRVSCCAVLVWNIFPRRVSACSSSCCSSWPRPSPLLPGQLLNWFLTEILIFQPSPSAWLAQGEYFKTIF